MISVFNYLLILPVNCEYICKSSVGRTLVYLVPNCKFVCLLSNMGCLFQVQLSAQGEYLFLYSLVVMSWRMNFLSYVNVISEPSSLSCIMQNS